LNGRVIVERAEALGVLTRALADARGGRGRLVFVGGEAGVGKTTLVRAFAERAGDLVTVRTGGCDPVARAPLGPFLDAVPEIEDDEVAEAGSPTSALVRRLGRTLRRSPTLLVIEDAHWADEASLTTLRHLGRRLDGSPLLVLVTFRDDEVSAGHPLATLLGDLASAPGASRLAVEPLTPAGVQALVEASVGRDGGVDAVALHRRTGGNPFFVTEALASRGGPLPATVRDAVLARVARLDGPARRVLQAAAVLGQPAEAPLLASIAGTGPEGVDRCVAAGMLVRQGVAAYGFRHELARLAVETTVLPGARADLHRAALAGLEARGEEGHVLALHAAGAGDPAAVLRHAVPAAARSARLGAHREAAALYRLALGADPDPGARLDLLERLSYECYLTDQLEDALASRRRARDLAEAAGDQARVGAATRWLSRLSWFLGRNGDSERYAARAVGDLEPLGDSCELAMAYSNLAQLRMLGGDLDGAVDWGGRALAVAARVGDRETEVHALNNVGSAQLLHGDEHEGRRNLVRSLDTAVALDLHEHAARAYTNLGTALVRSRRHAEGLRALEAGIAYCTERDLDSWRLYMLAWKARSTAESGRLTESRAAAREVLGSPHVSPIHRMVASAAYAQAAVRGGEDVGDLLDRALPEALATREAQRVVPVVVARAEAAWLEGRYADAAEEVSRGWPPAVTGLGPWDLGELAWWSTAAGAPRVPPRPIAEPFAALLQQDWAAAAEAWLARDCPVWAATALAHLPDRRSGERAVALAERVGASATAEALRRLRRGRGLPVPGRPRPATLASPGQLTARELEVLGLVADGMSNGEIAARLVLSERTVAHHVSAVLRKLDQPSRAAAAAAARRLGALPGGGLPTR
jgi:DNA-binding CsgD family transcriptional regulator/tetratricopeptide (TPR) repeat protein